jgi:hypothetical protein
MSVPGMGFSHLLIALGVITEPVTRTENLTISYPRDQARNLSNAKVFTSVPKIPGE